MLSRFVLLLISYRQVDVLQRILQRNALGRTDRAIAFLASYKNSTSTFPSRNQSRVQCSGVKQLRCYNEILSRVTHYFNHFVTSPSSTKVLFESSLHSLSLKNIAACLELHSYLLLLTRYFQEQQQLPSRFVLMKLGTTGLKWDRLPVKWADRSQNIPISKQSLMQSLGDIALSHSMYAGTTL